jgi:hypothetical protein
MSNANQKSMENLPALPGQRYLWWVRGLGPLTFICIPSLWLTREAGKGWGGKLKTVFDLPGTVLSPLDTMIWLHGVISKPSMPGWSYSWSEKNVYVILFYNKISVKFEAWWLHGFNPSRRDGGRGRWNSVSLRPAWSRQQVSGQPELHSKTLSQNENKETPQTMSVRRREESQVIKAICANGWGSLASAPSEVDIFFPK